MHLVVTNPVHALPFTHHQRSLLHHIGFHTTQTVTYHPKTTFPIIHCTDDTQLISLITHHTRFINLELALCDRWVLYAHIATLADSYLTEPSQYHNLALLVVPCLISARVSWINPLPYRSDSVCPCLDYCLCTWIISLPCPVGYCSPIVDPRLP